MTDDNLIFHQLRKSFSVPFILTLLNLTVASERVGKVRKLNLLHCQAYFQFLSVSQARAVGSREVLKWIRG